MLESAKHVGVAIFLLMLIVCTGTFGYMLIEGWQFLDALYMTIITLTTVGYSEVHQITPYGRVFTIFFIVTCSSLTVYMAGSLVQFMVEGRIRNILGRRRLDNRISKLRNHYIVCGYGRIGRVLCQNVVKHRPVGIVVVEKSPDLIPAMDEDQVLYIHGDATEESALIRAGIHHAKALIAALATDTDNVFLVLTARQISPDIFIMARSSQENARAKLKAAGANQVESPYDIGAVNMAMRLVRPTVTRFLDMALVEKKKGIAAKIQMEEIPVHAESKLAGVALKDSGIRQNYDLIIMAIKNENGEMFFNPSYNTRIMSGDTVIAIGEEENLGKLERVLQPKTTFPV